MGARGTWRAACELSTSSTKGDRMSENERDQQPNDEAREASRPRDSHEQDDLTRRRTERQQTQLTTREREERWPIG